MNCSTLTPLLCSLLVLSACSGESTEVGENGRPTAPAQVVPFVRGTIELTGHLATSKAGALQVVATAPGLATPLVRKCPIDTAERTPEGHLLVPFQLDSHSGMMASRAIPRDAMPEELSLKVSFSSDGYVENIQHEHDLTLPVRVGDLAVRARMVPGESPQSRPTSRPTSRPVVGED